MATATAPSPTADAAHDRVEMLNAALDYAARGWHVLPLRAQGKAPVADLVPHGKDDATTNATTITGWFATTDYNVGIACAPSGLLVLDADVPKPKNGYTDGRVALAERESELGALPRGPFADTGSSGHHRLFRAPGVQLVGKIGRAIDVIANGYIVAPRSLHESGRRYRWREGLSPDDVEIPELPPAWLEYLRHHETARAPSESASSKTAGAGDDFYIELARHDQRRVLECINGSPLVNGERFDFVRTRHGKYNLRVDRGDGWEATSNYIAADGTIAARKTGGKTDGGPLASTWCRYYSKTDAEIRRGLIEHVPELAAWEAARIKRAQQRYSNRAPDERESRSDKDHMSDDERDTFTDESDMSDEDRAAHEAEARDDVPPPDDEGAPTAAKQKRKPKIDGAVKVATKYVDKYARATDGTPLLRRWRGHWYRWLVDRGYLEQSDEQIRADIYQKLGLGKRADVTEVLDAMIAVKEVLIDHAELGDWLGDGAPPYPAREIAACRNGLLHLPSDALTPATPRYFATSTLGVALDRDAPPPREWMAFLRKLWPTDDESILLLQEWFGYLLTADTRLQKMLLAVGPRRSGKGTIGRAATALLGKSNVVNPTLASLGTTFGLASWIGKPAAIIGDARLSGRTDVAQVIERLLSISGEDGQTIGRKFLPDWNGTLSTRIMILTNEAPSFKDASDALPGRLLALELTRSWFGQEDHGLDTKLHAELAGILRWAIAGWRSLRRRGWFVQPQTSAGMIDEIEDLGSPVKAWARDRYRTDERDPQWWTVCNDAYADFKAWCEAQGHKSIPTQTMFGRDVKTALGCDRKQITREGVGRVHVYVGLAKGLK